MYAFARVLTRLHEVQAVLLILDSKVRGTACAGMTCTKHVTFRLCELDDLQKGDATVLTPMSGNELLDLGI